MRRWIWLGLLLAHPVWAQETMTFDTVDIEGDRKKAAWSSMGARAAWTMPTPITLPTRFSHHRVDLLAPIQPTPREEKPTAVPGDKNGR